MGVYDVESLTSLANQIAPYVSQVLASKHKKEVSSIDLVTDFTNLYSLPCYYWNRQTGVKRPVNVAISDVISTVETAANEELIKIKEMAKDSAESADRADQAAQQSAQSAAESAATALDQKNQTIDYLNIVKDDEATRVANENIRLSNEQERKTNESERINKENIRRSNEDIRIQNENDRIKNENERKSQEITRQSNESLRLEQEQSRQDAETIRNSNENTRISNENTRKTQETNRQNKEAERQQSETARINSENERNTNELTRIENENTRLSQEESRVNAENTRKEQETDRENAEIIREQNEDTRQNQESTRQSQEATRVSQESSRVSAESSRVNAENTRVSNENTRESNETTRTNNENSRKSAEQSRVTAETNRVNAEQDRVTAENNRKEQFNISKEAADQAADRANDVASHQPYIGEDLYWYLYDESTKSYNKTTKYSKGDNFSVKATFSSIAEMEAYVNPSVETASNPILKIGDFIVIATDVEQEDNAKLYVVSNVTSTKITFDYIADFSGARGFTGHTPQLSIGTITTGSAGTAASVSLTEDGIDANGNPKYKINFTIPRGDKGDTGEAAGFGTPIATIDANVGTPSVTVTASGADTAKVFNFDFKNLKGEKGDKGDPFTYDDFTEEQIAILQKPATDATAAANAAAQAANTAASNADQATADAINATANAETATNNANQAANNANDAASNANQAADNLNWDNLKDKPSTFTPSAHNHTISEVTNLQATLDGKADSSHTHSYLPLSGGTMTGALNFKNGTWNLMGDDAYIGDCDVAGMIGVKGANAATPGFALYNNSGTLLGKLFAVEATLVWSGDTIQTTNFKGNFKGNASSASYVESAPFNDEMEGTVATYKTYIHNALSNNTGIGKHVYVSDSIIEQWGNDSASYYPYTYSSIININGKYNGRSYGQFLVASWTKGLGLVKYQNGFENIRWYATRDSCLSLSGGTISGNLTVTGTITYGSLAQGSDVRKKNIINDTMLLIDDIANAPLFTYTYKDNEQDKRIHSGTSAQYWEGVNSGLFTTIMEDGSYGLMSSELSLCAAISIAKQFRDYKEQTDKKIEDLQNQINELKELINTLK